MRVEINNFQFRESIVITGSNLIITIKKLILHRNRGKRISENLTLPLDEICELSWKWIVFPVATMRMTKGEQYKFIIFNKGRFNKYYTEVKK